MSIRSAFLIVASMLCTSSFAMAGTVNPERPVQVAKLYDQEPLITLTKEPVLNINESYRYYDVKGTSTDEVRKQMRKNGTKWNDGHVYAALTTWNIKYNYGITKRNGAYVVSSVETNIDIKFDLPRWKPGSTPPAHMASQWDNYSERLIEHENGHRDLAVNAAAEVNKVLSTLGSFSSKQELQQEADRRVKAALDQHKKTQVAYDDHTSHGITQGAVLN